MAGGILPLPLSQNRLCKIPRNRFGGRARETYRAEKPAPSPGPTLRYRPAERRWAWRSDLVACADVESARFYGSRRHRSAPCRRHPRYKSLKLPLRSWGQRNRKFRIVRALNNLGYSERLAYNVVSLERSTYYLIKNDQPTNREVPTERGRLLGRHHVIVAICQVDGTPGTAVMTRRDHPRWSTVRDGGERRRKPSEWQLDRITWRENGSWK